MKYIKKVLVLLFRYRNEVQKKCSEIGVNIERLQSELNKLKSKEKEVTDIIEVLRNEDKD